MSMTQRLPAENKISSIAKAPTLRNAESVASLLAGLKSCSRYMDVEGGMKIHGRAVESGLSSNLTVATCLVNMYAKFGLMAAARDVFDGMRLHDVISWTALIWGYANNGEGQLAVDLFARLTFEGYCPNNVTYTAVLKAVLLLVEDCKTGHAEKGLGIHCHCVRSGSVLDTALATRLVQVYAKCGRMECASRVFDSMRHRDVVLWTVLVSGYAENGEGIRALEVFAAMRNEGCAPNAVTLVAALKACSVLSDKDRAGCLQLGLAVHSYSSSVLGFGESAAIETSLVSMYQKLGSLEFARRVFKNMSEQNAASWNALIFGHVENGQACEALQLFACMECQANALTYVAAVKACMALGNLENGRGIHARAYETGFDQDLLVATTLVDMYAKGGSMDDATRVFRAMPERNVVTWTALIDGYAEHGEGIKGLDLFLELKAAGCNPDAGIYVAALKACSVIPSLDAGRKIHCEIRHRGMDSDAFVAASLVDFYGKVGCIQQAQQLFDSLTPKCLVACTALMSGYCRYGAADRALQLFYEMRGWGLRVDRVVLLCVLTACSHSGRIREGLTFFDSMKSKYGVAPDLEHYSCMVDMLARANELEAAVRVAERVTPPSPELWKTILGACWKWKDLVVGRLAFEWMKRLKEDDVAADVLMRNIYSSLGMFEEESMLFEGPNVA